MTAAAEIVRIENDFSITDLDHPDWLKARPVAIESYWSGKPAEIGRQSSAALLWSDTALYVRFAANQVEPLVVSPDPILTEKTIGLWERDVCEFFVAPDRHNPTSYFEFEVAPTGEWLDLAITMAEGERSTDWNYASGFTTAARVEERMVITAAKIGWAAFGTLPGINDKWSGNFFRCVGAGPTRGYLAWQPTFTGQPNFHVPEAFGDFSFIV